MFIVNWKNDIWMFHISRTLNKKVIRYNIWLESRNIEQITSFDFSWKAKLKQMLLFIAIDLTNERLCLSLIPNKPNVLQRFSPDCKEYFKPFLSQIKSPFRQKRQIATEVLSGDYWIEILHFFTFIFHFFVPIEVPW